MQSASRSGRKARANRHIVITLKIDGTKSNRGLKPCTVHRAPCTVHRAPCTVHQRTDVCFRHVSMSYFGRTSISVADDLPYATVRFGRVAVRDTAPPAVSMLLRVVLMNGWHAELKEIGRSQSQPFRHQALEARPPYAAATASAS